MCESCEQKGAARPAVPAEDSETDSLEKRVEMARRDETALNRLIADYLPFIKKQAASLQLTSLEFEDAQSIAMIVFTNCVLQYEAGRGGFLSFARTCIRNRLIDEARKTAKNTVSLSFSANGGEMETDPVEVSASLLQYDRDRERRQLCEEIDEFSERLSPFGIVFSDLPRICPKQKKARMLCVAVADYISRNADHRRKLMGTCRLAQNELAEHFHLSVKTIEKHRKYIVTLAVLRMGDYPCIQAFLPMAEEVTR
ncbi:sigma-70 family RNA polymerase sigma factor [Bacilliculturomica massiliensis]|uniref:sigma-70 family RNA polymerase sigma factor n=1 Tax=Bacilliculturomica massiliensis TaxID=1917867 RepID=UPI00103259CA|nr:sigma-70 family RNA polymerase sigma factor [Bacilliculturomica massiliensis]